MAQTNLLLPGGYVGPGALTYPSAYSPNGAVIYVLSTTGADNRGRLAGLGGPSGPYGNPAAPLATVFGTNGALSYCSANRGDLVVVLQGHTETISGIVTVPAGVTVIGLGYGSSRPTISLGTTTTNTVTLNAGSRVQNCIFTGIGVDAIVSMFTTGGAGAQLVQNRIVMADGTNQALAGITVAHADCLISGNTIDSPNAGAAYAVVPSAAVARLRMEGNTIRGNFSVAVIGSTSTNHVTDMVIQGNNFVQRNGTAKVIFDFTTSSTGLVSNNVLNGTTWATAADAIANSSSTSLRWFQNYGFDDGAGVVSGILVPAAGTLA